MSRALLIGAALVLLPLAAAPGAPAVPSRAPSALSAIPAPAFPWKDGETVAYSVRWGMVRAAQAVFTAHAQAGGGWRFDLQLTSLGMVEGLYPIRDHFHSLVQTGPWRSVEFGQNRLEQNRERSDLARIDYARRLGTYQNLAKKTSRAFPVPAATTLEDLGSMLYSLRAGAWQPGTVRPLRIHNGGKLHPAAATFLRREAIIVPGLPEKVACLVVVVRSTDPLDRGSDRRLTLWIRDDAGRLPVRAEAKLRFGTFILDWLPNGAVPEINSRG